MKQLIKLLCVITLFTISLSAQEERKVLVEVFTNSHCPLCPAAHNVLDNYLAGTNGDKISYIYYHMVYPYNDDPLYWESQEGSDARNNYYNPVPATPQGWFDGIHQSSTSGWAASLDNLVTAESPLKIILSGTRDPENFYINAEVTRTGNVADNDLKIHFVVAEDLFYDGRNSVSDHKHVMRKMLPSPDGQSFSISLNETINLPQIIDLDPIWDADSLSVIAFVQSTGSKTVYQSETINYDELSVTEVKENNSSLNYFKLEQNYPNPFNPSKVIRYRLPVSSNVTLKVYDLMGKEIATLVDEYKPAGSYEVELSTKSGSGSGGDAYNLSSGIYFYNLTTYNPSTGLPAVQAGSGQNFAETKKMIYLK